MLKKLISSLIRHLRTNTTFNTKSALFGKMFYLFLIIPLILIAIPLSIEGPSIGGEDFPFLATPDYAGTKIFLWIENGSYSGFESLPRLPLIGLSYILSQINVNSEFTSKAIIVLGFGLASFSSFFSFLHILKDRFANASLTLRCAVLFGSVYYAYNIWSFHRIGHWYLWIGYALIPLFIYSLVYSFKHPNRWRYVLLAVFLATIAATTPQMIIFYSFIFVIIISIFSIGHIRKRNYTFLRPAVSIVSLFLLLDAFWIVPVALSSESATLGPSYVNTAEIFQILSRDSSMLNVVRLTQDWVLPRTINVEPPETSPLFPAWTIASMTIPVFAFSAILLRRNDKFILLLASVAIIAILLTMGSRAPIDFYSTILFFAPFSSFSWLFRDPDKWAFAVALSFAILSSVTVFEILNRIKKIRYDKILTITFILMILGSIIIYPHQVYKDTFEKKFDPVIIPADFNLLNDYLTDTNTDKVIFLPFQQSQTTWSKSHTVNSLYQISSVKGSIGPSSLMQRTYYEYMTDLITSNKTSSIDNLLYPLGTSYIIYHDDMPSNKNTALLSGLLQLDGIENIDDIGFFKVLMTQQEARPFYSPSQNLAIIGGLDVFGTLNQINKFNSSESSLIFLDSNTQQKIDHLKSSDMLITGKDSDDFVLSFLEERYLVAPFDSTVHHKPSELWSKASTTDPPHGPFHDHLSQLGLSNWDYDFGKGLVLTWARDKLEIPFDMDTDDNYEIYIRYLASPKGGTLRLSLDDTQLDDVSTLGKSTSFKWKQIGIEDLRKGTHTLTLENVRGFNAVNLFAVVPSSEILNLKSQLVEILEDLRVVHLFESESKLDQIDSDNTILFDGINGSHSITLSGNMTVPEGSSQASLQFWIRQSPFGTSSYKVNNIDVEPICNENVLVSDFENDQVPWINYDRNNLATAIEENQPIKGNKSLRVDVVQGRQDAWSTISSDFIPAMPGINHIYQIALSANDVNQLHARVNYFDADRKPLNTDVIFGGTDGTFSNTFSKSMITPDGTQYMNIQILVRPNPLGPSGYLLDDVSIQQVCPDGIFNNFEMFVNSHPNDQSITIDHDSLIVNVKAGNSTYWNTIRTQPFPINSNFVYTYKIELDTSNVNQLHAKTYFTTSRTSSEFNNQAGNGELIILPPKLTASTNVDILKASPYTIGIRAEVCKDCGQLRVSIGDTSKIFSLRNDTSHLEWVYFDTFLQEGSNELKIYSDSGAKLDLITIFSTEDGSDTLEEIISTNSVSAEIESIEKINPTEYIVKVNSTRPYMLSFAESYDPLWVARVNDGYEVNSVPLYSIINGFYIDQIGEHTVTIQYQPQSWFEMGGIVSTSTFLIFISYLIVKRTKMFRFRDLHLKITRSTIVNLIRIKMRSKRNVS